MPSGLSSRAFNGFYKGRRVFVTGHTGFKGSWLTEWLLKLGAEVTGYSLPVGPETSLFERLDLGERVHKHLEGDVVDLNALQRAMRLAQPEVVFHLAAQPLVRQSYRDPVGTHLTNVIGTVNVMEGLRESVTPCAAIIVTTDKCYENREWVHGYRETDRLGGRDPYSASKAAAELLVASYRHSFFGSDSTVKIASARAGNVIGGGDWAPERVVPDCIKALEAAQPLDVRSPRAVRPWQHVLEPLSGYLLLAAMISSPQRHGLDSAFNFGPGRDANRSVADLVEEILTHWRGSWRDMSSTNTVHEAELLQLNSDKAHALLGWNPTWSFVEAVRKTVAWYQNARTVGDSIVRDLTQSQIEEYCRDAGAKRLSWAGEQLSEAGPGQ